MSGKVILVGAGPGNLDLITIRGVKAIEQADVVVYDYLAADSLLVHAKPEAERIYVGKKAGDHTMEQEDINQLLIRKANEGNTVVRLKGGDPYIFGRGGEEIMKLNAAGVEFEVVPGIPAAIGMGAYAGIPPTDRSCASAVAFITGHEDPTKPESSLDWDALTKFPGTLIIYMGVGRLSLIADTLMANGKDPETSVSLVRWATTPDQCVVSGKLSNIVETARESGIEPPALIVIGPVNDLREQLSWFEQRPLFGKRIIATRDRSQGKPLTSALTELSAHVEEIPMIAIKPVEDSGRIDAELRRLSDYDWVFFTSVNGVDAAMIRIKAIGKDARAFANTRIAAVGSATVRRLQANGLTPDFMPGKFTSRALFDELIGGEDMTGKRVLLLRADIAPPEITNRLKAAGAEAVDIPLYRTVPADCDVEALREMIAAGKIDGVTFTSSSTVRFFIDALGVDFVKEHATDFCAFSIGPMTSNTLRDYGLEPAAEAVNHDIPGLVAAIAEHWQ